MHTHNLIINSFIPYSFNGMEKDDVVKGEGNSYDFGARMLDARVGRFLSVDPYAGKYPSLNPYNFVANSALIFVDPDGQKIKFSENLTKGEKKVYKAELKCLKNGSPTFKKMYNDLKKSKDIYTYDKTDELDGDFYDPESKTVFVNFNGNSGNFDISATIAHETGHGWRDLMGLDIKKKDSPYSNGTAENTVFSKKVELSIEFEGLHIENVVRSELGLELRLEYGEKTDYDADNKIILLGKEKLDLTKKQTVMVGKDSNYDYSDKNAKHYNKLLDRKHQASEINVNKYEDTKKYN